MFCALGSARKARTQAWWWITPARLSGCRWRPTALITRPSPTPTYAATLPHRARALRAGGAIGGAEVMSCGRHVHPARAPSPPPLLLNSANAAASNLYAWSTIVAAASSTRTAAMEATARGTNVRTAATWAVSYNGAWSGHTGGLAGALQRYAGCSSFCSKYLQSVHPPRPGNHTKP